MSVLRQNISRVVLLPLAILGILGFLFNTHLSFISPLSGFCYPKMNIVFLKTHKCAGSSIQNILMRFGDQHQLSFVLPREGNYLGHPARFQRVLVAWPRLPTYNILAHHTRFDRREIKSLMPWNSLYITIVRDPVQIFESSFAYYGLDKFFGGDIHNFIAKVPKLGRKFANRRYRDKFGANQMMFDLGADEATIDDESLAREYINRLDSWFHLVLVAERMEESLVLLRNLLCWELDDVVTFKLNARNPKFKSRLNDSEKQMLRELNHADVLLYNHFADKFDRHVETFDRARMASEVSELKVRTQQWYDLCVKGVQSITPPSSQLKYYYNPRVLVLEPNSSARNSTCLSMTMEELPYTDRLREKQTERLPWTYRQMLLHSKIHSDKYKAKLKKSRQT